ncbi:sigma-70 family RNA polymerase sigma factor [Paraburkholderia sp. NMBU_R16]|uniref:sigma-70 family RNA polymerase sigma factor n=1 Tax=Paraburkholderia sp. NMBU_R16 TaxID=2698676 RepID=UPI00156376F3|nr:sigma-70 family RNA polymerase sigma factor [Paraburkholderia sp. NMBU_R16]NRO99125.1 sigma-70 family RNA polymerase sigma factor [Paraburkholderia sp. NMBU_R16]
MNTDFTDDVLRELLPRLRRFALMLTRNQAAADDLVQGCMERAISRLATRRPDGDLRAWLFSILYRQFLNDQRRAKRYAWIVGMLGHDEEPTAQSTEDLVVARAALKGFDQLKPEQRALLLLVTVEGLSYREASETLMVPIGTVMSRLSRARQALRDLADGHSVASPLRVLK